MVGWSVWTLQVLQIPEMRARRAWTLQELGIPEVGAQRSWTLQVQPLAVAHHADTAVWIAPPVGEAQECDMAEDTADTVALAAYNHMLDNVVVGIVVGIAREVVAYFDMDSAARAASPIQIYSHLILQAH